MGLNENNLICIFMNFNTNNKNRRKTRENLVPCFSWIFDIFIKIRLRNEFCFSGVHGAMHRSGSRAK